MIGPFATFLKEEDIIAQYTMPGTPQQNGVCERRNRTLMDMVRSMIINFDLPLSVGSEALKTVVYILNRVPSRVVPMTPFELWKGWKPSLNHLHIWGCPVEVRIYYPQLKKLDSRTTSGYFIGYGINTKGYIFYCLSHTPRIVESRNTKFFEESEISGSTPRNIEFKETRDMNVLHIDDLMVAQYKETSIEQQVREPVIDSDEVPHEHILNEGIRRSTRNKKNQHFLIIM